MRCYASAYRRLIEKVFDDEVGRVSKVLNEFFEE